MPQTSNNTRPTSQDELRQELEAILYDKAEVPDGGIIGGKRFDPELAIGLVATYINRHYIAKEAVAEANDQGMFIDPSKSAGELVEAHREQIRQALNLDTNPSQEADNHEER